MPYINLLPKQKTTKIGWWITGSVGLLLLLLLSSGIGRYFFDIYSSWASHTLIPPSSNSQASLKGLLPNYSIHKLQMVGFLKHINNDHLEVYWGLIQSPDAQITPVKVGDYIGKEYLQIVEIGPLQICLRAQKGTESIFIRNKKQNS